MSTELTPIQGRVEIPNIGKRESEYINGNPVKMGTFYLDTWENSAQYVASFTANDIIGLFDSITYKTSSMWTNVVASIIFDDIFATAGWTKYNIETSIANELISNYIPAVSVRKALHQLCFALRCSCIPDRNGVIQIKRLPSADIVNAIEKSSVLIVISLLVKLISSSMLALIIVSFVQINI